MVDGKQQSDHTKESHSVIKNHSTMKDPSPQAENAATVGKEKDSSPSASTSAPAPTKKVRVKKPSPTQQRKAEEVRLAVMFGSLIYDYGDTQQTPATSLEEIAESIAKYASTARKRTQEKGKSEAKANQAIFDVLETEIPSDPEKLRQSRAFQSLRKLIHFQRDQYLVGERYAALASEERYKAQPPKRESDVFSTKTNRRNTMISSESSSSSLNTWTSLRRLGSLQQGGKRRVEPSFPPSILPYDPNALGHHQLAEVLANQLLPLPALREAALPIVCKIPEWIYEPTKDSLVSVILGQASTLDHVLKSQLLNFLDNPNNRTSIKNSTQGFILSSSPRPQEYDPT